jgi:DNA-binding XRE family transcriptional regulator
MRTGRWLKWGQRIRTARGDRTQCWLAETVGVNQTTVSAWENGRCTPSDPRKLSIAEALGVRLDKLFPWSDVEA